MKKVNMLFKNRNEAGILLASDLSSYKNQLDVLVIGLARGGVVIAYEIAKKLNLPLNVVVPRKIGAPGNPELALGSIMANGEGVFNDSIINLLNVSQDYLSTEIEKEKVIAQQRENSYRRYAPLAKINSKIIILVDDGIATGSTMLASIQAMRGESVKKVIVAAPVASVESARLVKENCDEFVCPHVSRDFIGVGMYYENFDQVSDSEVIELLQKANKKNGNHSADS